MTVTYKILKDLDSKKQFNPKEEFALDVLNGLSNECKKLSSKYFYDDEGSKIFTQICELPEYYLTRLGYEILEKHKGQIAELVTQEPFRLIELGAGDGCKTKILLDYFLSRGLNFHYVPIDISEKALFGLMNDIETTYPSLEVEGLVGEYFNGIEWLVKNGSRKNLVLFLGSNIGNFNKQDEIVFLQCLRQSLNKDDILLIAFDLKKDVNLIHKAYNDSRGITKEFNLNLLRRINNELGGNFDISKFDFLANYNPISGAVESYLISTKEQTVYIKELDKIFYFKAWEPIHTESSYKYLDSDIKLLAHKTGFQIEKRFYDSKKYYTQNLWRVR